jgi:GSH-dependent disulfide-bond oxidoreductase
MTALHLLSGPTPNGRKVTIMLHECGLAYDATFIDILAGDQLAPDFLALNPNNKHPVLVDAEGPDGAPITVWESGAILIYLAEKCGRLIPTDPRRRIETLKWLFFQVANQGPYAGQYAHFAFYAKEEHRYPYAIARYRNELDRQMGIMNMHLERHEFFADEYSIADIALLPYVASMALARDTDLSHLRRWKNQLLAREAVRIGMAFMEDKVQKQTIAGGMQGFGDEHRSVLFGERQYKTRR